jgi:hypothetical protein
MRKRILTVAGLTLLATFVYVPRGVPLGEFVGATAVVAEQCNKYTLCAWVNVLIYKFEFCIENVDCPNS